MKIFNDTTMLYVIGIILFAIVIGLSLYLKYYSLFGQRNVIKGVKKDKHIFANLECSRWLTQKEITKNFRTVNYKKLAKQNIEGIPVSAEYRRKKLKVSFAKPIHTLAIGTTGSGKTTTFINPTIQILSQSKSKPSMLITDPKGGAKRRSIRVI